MYVDNCDFDKDCGLPVSGYGQSMGTGQPVITCSSLLSLLLLLLSYNKSVGNHE